MSAEDRAQELEAHEWARNNRMRESQPMYEPGDKDRDGKDLYGPELCESCDIEMPELRRAMGRCLCVDCTDREALRKKLQGA